MLGEPASGRVRRVDPDQPFPLALPTHLLGTAQTGTAPPVH